MSWHNTQKKILCKAAELNKYSSNVGIIIYLNATMIYLLLKTCRFQENFIAGKVSSLNCASFCFKNCSNYDFITRWVIAYYEKQFDAWS